jgi:Protein of unknown function (DUF2635).
MSEKIFVTPGRPGLVVLNFTRPDNRPIAQEGEWVPEDPQWIRYESAGDVKIGEPVKAKSAKKKEGDEA